MKRLLLFLYSLNFLSSNNLDCSVATTTNDLKNKKIFVYTTAKDTELRLEKTGMLSFRPLSQPTEDQVCIFVDPEITYQSFIGIGGSVTDAVAETYAKLAPEEQQEFLTAYYSKDKGIGYTFGRTTIGSCDFSNDSYSYIKENDTNLSTFNVSHDEQYRIPLIKKCIEAAGGKLPIFVSPWSPPAWMKTNNSLLHGGKIKPEYRQLWADYYIKFINTYQSRGIPVWGLSVQNEPMATQRWESCIYTAEEERDFIKNFLGPTLKNNGMSSKKLIAWDHNRDQIFQRASILLNDKQSAKYIWGIGFHWYETWTGSDMLFDNLRLVNQAFPDKNLIFTEGCVEKFDRDSIKSWALGERYGYSMINDFNNGTVAWTDWNMLLDETGGPNHVGNFCFAPIHADTKTGKLIYTNSYYYLGHFSKFIRPGAKRVGSSSNRDKLITTAFLNTDGKLAVIVMNRTPGKVPFKLWMKGHAADAVSLPHSISTFVID